MSKFVRVATELRDVDLVKHALTDLDIEFDEHAQYDHRWTRTSTPVRILVRAMGLTFGMREAEDGGLEIVGDDMRMKSMQDLAGKIQQRYAYHSVLAQTAAAGFDLVEERVGEDNVIRLTVRRWS